MGSLSGDEYLLEQTTEHDFWKVKDSHAANRLQGMSDIAQKYDEYINGHTIMSPI